MNFLSRQALWQKLQERDLVEGSVPALERTDSPWYVRVMLGIAGWIGSLFLFGFVGVGFSFVMQSAIASLVVGSLVCCGAFALFRLKRDSDFVTQFGLAVGLVGQMLLVYGFFELFGQNEAICYVAVFVVEVVLTMVMPNFIYRVISSMAAGVALSFALNSFGAYGVASALMAAGFALVWLQDARWVRFSRVCRPVGYGLALSLLLYRASLLWGRGLWWPRSYRGSNWLALYTPWLGKALLIAVFLAVVLVLLKRMHIAVAGRTGITILAGATLVMAVSFQTPGIASALLIIVIGFAVCNRVILGLGLLAFGSFLSNYYYMMQSTLLAKSMLLLGFGAVLLVSRLIIRAWLPPAGQGGHADA